MADILVIIKPSMCKMDLKLFGIKQPVQTYSESCFSVVHNQKLPIIHATIYLILTVILQ